VNGRFGLILRDDHQEDYLPMLDRLIELLEPGGYLISDDALCPVRNLPARAEGCGRSIERYNQAWEARTGLRTIWLADRRRPGGEHQALRYCILSAARGADYRAGRAFPLPRPAGGPCGTNATLSF
jgi:hypothetical protein